MTVARALVLSCSLLFPLSTWAEETPAPAPEPTPAPAAAVDVSHHEEKATAGHHEEKGEGEEWMHHRDSFTFFGGATIAFPFGGAAAEGEGGGEGAATGPRVGATFGLDYSYRVSKYIGLGVYVDYALKPVNAATIGPLLLIYPVGGLFIELAPSISGSTEEEAVFLGRLALGYEFDITSWLAVGAYLAGDVSVRDVAIVPGVTVAVLF